MLELVFERGQVHPLERLPSSPQLEHARYRPGPTRDDPACSADLVCMDCTRSAGLKSFLCHPTCDVLDGGNREADGLVLAYRLPEQASY